MAPGACVRSIAVFLLLCCSACPCHCFLFFFSIPAIGRRHRSYLQGEEIRPLVTPMATLINMLPADYYSLPFCKPPRGVGSAAGNLGEMLLPDGTQNSPYRFRINVNESLYLCTTDPLTARDLDLLLRRKFHHYAVHMTLDDLPLMSLDRDYSFKPMRGYFLSHMRVYPVDWVYVINHLKFQIFLHEQLSASPTRYEIVGFEVVPCSVGTPRHSELGIYDNVDPPDCRWDVDAFVKARRGERLTFTYEVEYINTNRSWSSRWDPYYLKVKSDRARSFSVLGSFATLLILVVFCFVKLSRSTLRELTAFCGASNSEGSRVLRHGDEGIPGWKLIAGDVFRAPNSAKLLCVAVGTGVEIILVAFICIVLGALGTFMYPAPRGMLLTWVLLLYLFFGFVGGYVGVWLWGSITGSYRGWRSVCYWIAAFFPGVVFFVTGLLNLAYWVKGSSFASSTVASYWCLLALWACVLLPLTFCGGFLATKHKPLHPPVEINIVPKKMPPRQLRSWLLILDLGYLIPSSFILDELFLIFHSICYGWYYYSPVFLLAAILLSVTACSLTSVLVTYNHICASDWKWWWKSLLASGFTGFYVFLYAVKYLLFNLRGFVSEAPLSITVYLGWSVVAALAVMLATGAIGFLASFYFVRFLYAFSKV